MYNTQDSAQYITLYKCYLFYFFIFFCYFLGIWRFMCLALNVSCSCELHSSCGNDGSYVPGWGWSPRLSCDLSHCSWILNPLHHSGNSSVSFYNVIPFVFTIQPRITYKTKNWDTETIYIHMNAYVCVCIYVYIDFIYIYIFFFALSSFFLIW